MTSLIGNLSNDYLKATNSLKPKADVKSVSVYVEDNEDISFWYNILNFYEKQAKIEFDILTPSQDYLATGKKDLEKLFDNTGEYLIICLDSDYDYILQGYSETSIKINNNPYIFQTYAYATENLKCYAESLSNVCVQATHNADKKINFPEFVKQYSEIIYDLFIWNLYFYSINDTTTFNISDFSRLIGITENPEINDYGKAELEKIRINVNNKLQELHNQFPKYAVNVTLLAEDLCSRGLDNANTYLFIHGHTLYDNVILIFLKSVCKALKKDKKENIKVLAKHEKEEKDRLRSYENSAAPPATILKNNDKFKECFLFKKIENDIEEYLKRHIVQVDIISTS